MSEQPEESVLNVGTKFGLGGRADLLTGRATLEAFQKRQQRGKATGVKMVGVDRGKGRQRWPKGL